MTRRARGRRWGWLAVTVALSLLSGLYRVWLHHIETLGVLTQPASDALVASAHRYYDRQILAELGAAGRSGAPDPETLPEGLFLARVDAKPVPGGYIARVRAVLTRAGGREEARTHYVRLDSAGGRWVATWDRSALEFYRDTAPQ